MNALLIDCSYSGVSGDMLLSALAPIVGVDKLHGYLEQILKNFARIKQYSFNFDSLLSHGISGLHLNLSINEIPELEGNLHFKSLTPVEKSPLSPQNAPSEAHHHAHYSGKKLREELVEVLNLQPISDRGKETALTILSSIIEAEAAVHGTPIDKVHLHEIGAVDTLLDIAGTIFALDSLGVFLEKDPVAVYITPISVGGGTVKTAHGMLPVPAPASAKILEKYHIPYRLGPVDFELATPTGIAIVAGLSLLKNTKFGRPKGTITLIKKGIGVGTKQFSGRANLLKIDHFKEKLATNASPAPQDLSYNVEQVYLLETNVDDVRGEILGDVIPILMAAGALDVNIYPSIAKKNRPGHLITVLVKDPQIQAVAGILFGTLGTLGIRLQKIDRITLDREIITKEIELNNQKIRIPLKIARDPEGNILHRKIEFEDLQHLAKDLGLPIHEVEKLIWGKLSY